MFVVPYSKPPLSRHSRLCDTLRAMNMDYIRTRLQRLSRRERKRAQTHLDQAADGDACAPFHLGAALLQANEALPATRLLEQAVELGCDHPDLPDALVSAYRRDARYAEALRAADHYAPTRQILYEKAVALAALGKAEAALAAFDRVLAEHPDHAASWLGSHAPALHLWGMEEARRRLARALACPGGNGKYAAYAYAYDRLCGLSPCVVDPRHRALADGVDSLMHHLAADVRIMAMSAPMLRHALSVASTNGLVLEFGVRRGTSLTVLAEAADQDVHGFDSFEGLPVDWGSEPAGVLSTGAELPLVPANAHLHAGWFADTLPGFLDRHPGPVRLVNVDSDVYESARFVLECLTDRIRPGTVLVFDELIGNRSWAEDEYRAFSEFTAATGARFEIAAISPFTKQVVVRIVGTG